MEVYWSGDFNVQYRDFNEFMFRFIIIKSEFQHD